MPRTISAQCCFATSTVQIEVPDDEDLHTALNRAIEEAQFGDGSSSDPGASLGKIEVPHLLTERGQMRIDIPSDAENNADTSDTVLTRTSS